MIRRLKTRESIVVAVCLCVAFLLVSCAGMPAKGPSAGTSNSQVSPEVAESVKIGVNDEEKDLLSDRADGGAEENSDVVWQDVEGEETIGTEGSDDEAPGSSANQENTSAVEEGADTAKDDSHHDELKIEEKNAQALNTEKEEENSDQLRLYDAIDFCQKSQELWKQGNLEKAKRSLDQAYQSILDIKSDGDPEIIQQIDDLRFLIAKRVLEIYASRLNGVKGNHNEIPLIMNDHVQA